MTPLSYNQARHLIETGDTIAVKGKSGLLALATSFFTRSDYTHVGVAFWMGSCLWMFEINSGRNHAIPLSQLRELDFDVFCRPPELTKESVLHSVVSNLRDKVDYGFLAIPVIGLIEYLKIKLVINWRKVLVCSGIVVKVYEDAGWPNRSRVISPRALTEMLSMRLTISAKAGKAETIIKEVINA